MKKTEKEKNHCMSGSRGVLSDEGKETQFERDPP